MRVVLSTPGGQETSCPHTVQEEGTDGDGCVAVFVGMVMVIVAKFGGGGGG